MTTRYEEDEKHREIVHIDQIRSTDTTDTVNIIPYYHDIVKDRLHIYQKTQSKDLDDKSYYYTCMDALVYGEPGRIVMDSNHPVWLRICKHLRSRESQSISISTVTEIREIIKLEMPEYLSLIQEPYGYADMVGALCFPTSKSDYYIIIPFFQFGVWPVMCGHLAFAAVTAISMYYDPKETSNSSSLHFMTPSGIISVRSLQNHQIFLNLNDCRPSRLIQRFSHVDNDLPVVAISEGVGLKFAIAFVPNEYPTKEWVVDLSFKILNSVNNTQQQSINSSDSLSPTDQVTPVDLVMIVTSEFQNEFKSAVTLNFDYEKHTASIDSSPCGTGSCALTALIWQLRMDAGEVVTCVKNQSTFSNLEDEAFYVYVNHVDGNDLYVTLQGGAQLYSVNNLFM